MTYRYISNFARTAGAKDKKKRDKRNVAGMVAGGVAGAGALGGLGVAGVRYGVGKARSQAQQMNRDTDSAKLKESFKARSQQLKTTAGNVKGKASEIGGKVINNLKANKLAYGLGTAGALAAGGGAAYLYNRNKNKKAAETFKGRASAMRDKIKSRLGR